MGAEQFWTEGTGETVQQAFTEAVQQAQYDHGHSGYSGTIAEKGSFTEIELPEGKDAAGYADELMDADDPRVEDKWGPAGALKIVKGRWLFFGWASS